MALPDIYCWVKVLLTATDKVVPDGAVIQVPGSALVRYVVANDSNKAAGPLTIVGVLDRNGVRVKPAGQPNVVPAQTITVQPNQIWKKEYTVNETNGGTQYVAKILGDIGKFVNEEDETNNAGQGSFSFVVPPPPLKMVLEYPPRRAGFLDNRDTSSPPEFYCPIRDLR